MRQARAVADRKTGVGCDQLIVIEPPKNWPAPMPSCASAMPTAARSRPAATPPAASAQLLMREQGKSRVAHRHRRPAVIWRRHAGDGRVTVDIGPGAAGLARDPARPRDGHAASRSDAQGPLSDPVAVNVGNPHVVFFVAGCRGDRSGDAGARSSSTIALFPERCNIEVVRPCCRRRASACACGSAASASPAPAAPAPAPRLVAAVRRGLTGRRAEVVLDGGTLEIEWLATDHVLMTGPVAHELHRHARRVAAAGRPVSPPPPRLRRADPAKRAANSRMSAAEIITFGCRLNAFESEVMRGHARRGRPRRRDHRQHLRRHRRGRAPGAPGHPPGAARASGGAHHRHRLRARRSTPPATPRCPRSITSSATTRSCRPRASAASLDGDAPRASWSNDIMAVRETAAIICSPASPSAARLPPGAAGLRSSLHLLHHPVRPRPQPQRAHRRDRAPGARAGRKAASREIVLTGVDITAYGADLPGRPALGQMVRRLLAQVPELRAPAAVLARSRRDRRGPACA